jgi:lon-related putative ATP-dependent protease
VAHSRLTAQQLFHGCDPEQFSFETTAELSDLEEIVGHERAVAAVDFGIAIRAPGFNLYAMGPEGIGKYTLIRQFLTARAASEPVPPDRCYVHSFDDPRRPRLLTLPAGRGARLRDRMAQLSRELRVAISAALDTEQFRNRKQALEDDLKRRREEALAAFERHALGHGVALLRTPIGIGLAPMRDGRILETSELERRPEEERRAIREVVTRLEAQLSQIIEREMPRWEREHWDAHRGLIEEVTRTAAGHLIDDVRREFEDLPEVINYLSQVQRDVVENAEEVLAGAESATQALLASRAEPDERPSFRRYRVNLLVDNTETRGAPLVFEDHPTQPNLVGRVEHVAQLGTLVTDFSLIRAGALHRANGGYLVLDARKVLGQPFAWDELKRALRAREVRIETLGERLGLVSTVSLEPEPVPLDVKIVLVGDRAVYYLLCAFDPDFLELFKVQADFDDELRRSPEEEQRFVCLFGTVARREGLRPLDRSAAARMVEHAARLAGDGERMSTHLRNLTDVIREADHRAGRAGRDRLTGSEVQQAIDARTGRASRVHERVLDEIGRGRILVSTEQEVVGQVNGLTVAQVGETRFGWPVRITTRVGLGEGRIIDIEREVELGGPLHSKGVLILAGFIAGRYGRTQPLSLQATLVFEQSYAGVEGDSASLAEACALLSAIGEIPLAQSYAMTGSVNQHGDVQPIGGVNEKIEGFFDVCSRRGLTGNQGVIIPSGNAGDLMLRQDVVEAVAEDRFQVVTVETIDDAIEILSGLSAGQPTASGTFPVDSVNGRVAAGLRRFAESIRQFASPLVPIADGHRPARDRSRPRPRARSREI